MPESPQRDWQRESQSNIIFGLTICTEWFVCLPHSVTKLHHFDEGPGLHHGSTLKLKS
jgi:hypothetical protein